MAIYVILLAVIFSLLAYFIHKYKKHLNYFRDNGIPCEEPHIIMGSVAGVRATRSFPQCFEEYYKKFKGKGPFAGFYFFLQKSVIVLDPALMKLVLIKEFNNFTDRGFYHNEEDDPLTGQLFLLDGQKWRNMRSKLSPTFTSGKMKFMFPTLTRIGEEFVNVLSETLKEDSVVDMRDMCARYTTDVIGTCAFGIDCSSLKDPNVEFREMGRKALVETRQGTLGIAFIVTFQELSRKLHIKQTTQEIEDFFMRIVRETVKYREENKVRRNDFMDMLIDLKNNKLMKSENGEELTNLTIEEIAAQAFVFFNAGFETSSTTMSFALYELAQHQDLQQKVREEIIEVFEKYDQVLTYESMNELVYLDQVIAETLRLYTVLPVLNRVALSDYVVPGHPKFIIKKGMHVIIPIGAMHRDPEYYPNPDEFNPENFSAEKVRERDSILYQPFGEGPRNCIGMRFGKMQTRIGLAFLLKNFKFSVCSQTKIPLKYDNRNFLISTVGGIYLKVEKV